jgi:hypothetical protein
LSRTSSQSDGRLSKFAGTVNFPLLPPADAS